MKLSNILVSSIVALPILYGATLLFSSEKIGATELGLLVNQYGAANERGAANAKVVSGRVWYNPFTHEVITVPARTQRYEFTSGTETGSSEKNEAITFSLGGVRVVEDIGASVLWTRDGLAAYYQQYGVSPEAFMATNFKTALNSCYNFEAQGVTPQQYQLQRNEIAGKVLSCLQAKFDDVFEVQSVDLIGQPLLPENVQKALNEQAAASQLAQKAIADQEQARAQGDTEVARAKATADALIEEARGKAEAAKLEASAVTPQLLESQKLEIARLEAEAKLAEVEKWDGKRVGTTIQTHTVQVGTSN
jgi:regulator of protease activity HflC (stomatin/prohibitin superfamily)